MTDVPDVYATITEADPAVVEQLADILELRAADPQQRELRDAYLRGIPFDGARVARGRLRHRCRGSRPRSASRRGRGRRRRPLAGAARAGPRARRRRLVRRGRRPRAPARGRVAGRRRLPHDAVPHSRARPGARRGVAGAPAGRTAGGFDGDYATTTMSTGPFDPLQACADAVVDFLVHDPYLVRSLPRLAAAAGFEVERLRGHSYVEAPSSGGYMVTLAERGAGHPRRRGPDLARTADALAAEARRRSDEGVFFGHIAYASLSRPETRVGRLIAVSCVRSRRTGTKGTRDQGGHMRRFTTRGSPSPPPSSSRRPRSAAGSRSRPAGTTTPPTRRSPGPQLRQASAARARTHWREGRVTGHRGRRSRRAGTRSR